MKFIAKQQIIEVCERIVYLIANEEMEKSVRLELSSIREDLQSIITLHGDQ